MSFILVCNMVYDRGTVKIPVKLVFYARGGLIPSVKYASDNMKRGLFITILSVKRRFELDKNTIVLHPSASGH